MKYQITLKLRKKQVQNGKSQKKEGLGGLNAKEFKKSLNGGLKKNCSVGILRMS